MLKSNSIILVRSWMGALVRQMLGPRVTAVVVETDRGRFAIAPHFSSLNIPSQKVVLTTPDFLPHLQSMADAQQGDDSIVFTKD
jgi:hypothetical protein